MKSEWENLVMRLEDKVTERLYASFTPYQEELSNVLACLGEISIKSYDLISLFYEVFMHLKEAGESELTALAENIIEAIKCGQ